MIGIVLQMEEAVADFYDEPSYQLSGLSGQLPVEGLVWAAVDSVGWI